MLLIYYPISPGISWTQPLSCLFVCFFPLILSSSSFFWLSSLRHSVYLTFQTINSYTISSFAPFKSSPKYLIRRSCLYLLEVFLLNSESLLGILVHSLYYFIRIHLSPPKQYTTFCSDCFASSHRLLGFRSF